jgi:hypothetical protein
MAEGERVIRAKYGGTANAMSIRLGASEREREGVFLPMALQRIYT